MRLRMIANGLTSNVNRNVEAVIKASTGYDISEDGSQIPKFAEYTRTLQLQEISSTDLEHFGFANMQGLFMTCFVNDDGDDLVNALNREDQKGNSMIETKRYGKNETKTWQVVKIVQHWEDDYIQFIIRFVGTKNGN